ncbi:MULTISPECIES: hypothetical protein [Streptomyces phaeochromogenes group]|uniref:hypothetical protein n=1 Tax=Streptomyces phaeochromogenes group TaxID=2838332 RepID=UPI0019A77970|nr:hypothetical protein GCM10010306_014340 [Streptomyces umbrinus]
MTQPTLIRRDPGQRPRLLDLFSCAGGAAVGYARTGFDTEAIPPAYGEFIGRAFLAGAGMLGAVA